METQIVTGSRPPSHQPISNFCTLRHASDGEKKKPAQMKWKLSGTVSESCCFAFKHKIQLIFFFLLERRAVEEENRDSSGVGIWYTVEPGNWCSTREHLLQEWICKTASLSSLLSRVRKCRKLSQKKKRSSTSNPNPKNYPHI